jgi:hypothetical protein
MLFLIYKGREAVNKKVYVVKNPAGLSHRDIVSLRGRQ